MRPVPDGMSGHEERLFPPFFMSGYDRGGQNINCLSVYRETENRKTEKKRGITKNESINEKPDRAKEEFICARIGTASYRAPFGNSTPSRSYGRRGCRHSADDQNDAQRRNNTKGQQEGI